MEYVQRQPDPLIGFRSKFIGAARPRSGSLRTEIDRSRDNLPFQDPRNKRETVSLPSGEVGPG
jgi:hypothetical protein